MSEPERVLTLIVLVGAALAALIGIWRGLRGIMRFFERINRFFEDWYGSPAEDGHPAKRGVLHRLDDLEAKRSINTDTLARLETKVDEAIHELTPNEGGSMKDSINRIEVQQQEEVLEHKNFRDQYEQDQITNRLERHALTKVIREMIGKEPEYQIMMWDKASESWVDNRLHENDTPQD